MAATLNVSAAIAAPRHSYGTVRGYRETGGTAKVKCSNNATVAELVDAQDLGSCGATRGGSSPSGRIAAHGNFRSNVSITACSCLRKRSSPYTSSVDGPHSGSVG